MKKFALIFLVVSFFLVAFYNLNVHRSTVPVPTPFKEADSRILWNLVEEWRVNQNLQPYTEAQSLCQKADVRVQDIQEVFSHDRFHERYSELPYLLSENLGEKYPSEQAMLDAWIASPTHKENLLKLYTYSCLRCLNNKCVQLFSNL